MYSEAGDGLRVLTTRFSTRQVLEDTSADRRKLEAEKDELLVVAARINSEIASLKKNMELLAKLENVTEKKDHTGDEIITMTKYVMDATHRKGQGNGRPATNRNGKTTSSSTSPTASWPSLAAARAVRNGRPSSSSIARTARAARCA